MKKKLKLGTRDSPLALRQVEELKQRLSEQNIGLEFDIVKFKTAGDKDKETPIAEMEGTDFFTREIDTALKKGEIDLAQHSAKDLPEQIPEGLQVAVITESADLHDALVSEEDLKLDDLPKGAKIGTSSIRRKTQLKQYRDDLVIEDLRGNIHQRLETLYNSELDAILIAAIGLTRLDLGHEITQIFPYDIIEPHPLQGRLAVTVNEKDEELYETLQAISIPEKTKKQFVNNNYVWRKDE